MQFKNIIVAGDIHGDLNQIAYYQKFNKLKNTLFLQAGDFGIGFKSKEKELATLKYYNDIFKSKNNFVYACRGNHDDPSYFTNEYDTSNIKLMPDYSVLEIEFVNELKRILFIGGAISVDRMHRKAYIFNGERGSDYWKDEPVKFNQEALNNIKDIDLVITHTAPNFCKPIHKHGIEFFIANDKTLVADVDEERVTMTIIYQQLALNSNIQYWCYGHFHHYEFDDIYGTKFVMVNMNDFYPIQYL